MSVADTSATAPEQVIYKESQLTVASVPLATHTYTALHTYILYIDTHTRTHTYMQLELGFRL